MLLVIFHLIAFSACENLNIIGPLFIYGLISCHSLFSWWINIHSSNNPPQERFSADKTISQYYCHDALFSLTLR